MSRIKKGLDYFCFTTDTFHDLRIKRLRRLCRTNGLLVYFYLINEAYRVEGYYVKVDDELILDTAEYFYLTEEEVKRIIETCCNEELFDLETYNKYGVLTSTTLQERYAETCYKLRRSNISIRQEIWMTDPPEVYVRNKEKTTKEGEAPEVMSGHSPSICPQKKGNEMKGNEMKPLPSIPSPENGRGDCRQPVEAAGGGEGDSPEKRKDKEGDTILPCQHTPCPRGEGRNYSGMVDALLRLRIAVKDINGILQLSNFGEVGDPAWRAIYTINNAPPGTFKQPAKYIYSIIQKARRQEGGAR